MKYLFLRILLMPFGIFYLTGVWLRNLMYSTGWLKSVQFEVPVISVGNLKAGGTGKSPMVEYLARLLSGQGNIAILSRGYRRMTSGFRMASDEDTPETLGDEPYQFYRKFGGNIRVAVGEERMTAIPEILSDIESGAIIILDDAFQHRSVKPGYNILLTTFDEPFFKDYILPMGMLREPRSGAARADCIVVTRCPAHLPSEVINDYKNRIHRYAPAKDVFFSYIEYGDPVPFNSDQPAPGKDMLLVTGIAQAEALVEYLKRDYNLVDHLQFGDHHRFLDSDIRKIREKLESVNSTDKCLMVTEKDMVKLDQPGLKSILGTLPAFYIPIRIKFVEDGNNFDAKIKEAVCPEVNEN